MPTKTDSLRTAQALFERLRTDEPLRVKVTGVKTYQEFLTVAREAGFDLGTLTEEDLRAFASTGNGELSDAELAGVAGGFQSLSSAISEVMKNFGGALQTAARG
jgi:predicted ribosomally synthesized peptide with nif11-like leader